jgi:tRNA threonylcarbamoyladenosine biosynthesis protein TsaE
MIWQLVSTGSDDTENLGEVFGRHMTPPAILELRADLGGGKTTFVRGLVRGLGNNDTVSSPTFTLSRVYKTAKADVAHFDFYRLDEPGVLKDELEEYIEDKKIITVIEWSDIVKDVLPRSRITIEFKPTANDADERQITVTYTPEQEELIRQVETDYKEVRP